MDLTTYDGLRAAVAEFLQRDDLAATVPAFISLAQASINRDVRHWRMERREPITLDARYVPLPADWVETIRLTGSDRFRALALVSTGVLDAERPGASTAEPGYYRHTAGSIEIFPVPGEPFTGEILYYAKVPALSDAEPTNWLLDEAPDVYLYGSLIQSAPYLIEDERALTWGALYSAAVKRLNDAGQASTMSGTRLRMRTPR